MKSSVEQILFKHVQANLAKTEKEKHLVKLFMRYSDQNSEILYDSGMTVRPMFHPSLDEEIVSAIGLSLDDCEEFINTCPSIRGTSRREKSFDKPIYHALLTSVVYFLKRKKEREAILMNLFLALRFYSSLHRKYFPHGVKKEIMDYTVSNLTNKFDIKAQGNLIKALDKMAINNLNTYRDKYLGELDDEKFMLYMESLRTRCNSLVQNISDEYYTNWKAGNYMNTDRGEFTTSDGESIQIERTNASSTVVQAASAFSIWFNSSSVDLKLVDTVAKQTETAPSTIRHVLEKIKEKDNQAIPIISENLFALLLEEQGKTMNSICSRFWVPFAISQFSKTNTENILIINIRKILNSLLEKYSVKFAGTRREATRMNYRRALLLYFALLIQRHRCN